MVAQRYVRRVYNNVYLMLNINHTGTMAGLFSDLEIAFRKASSAPATLARWLVFGVT